MNVSLLFVTCIPQSERAVLTAAEKKAEKLRQTFMSPFQMVSVFTTIKKYSFTVACQLVLVTSYSIKIDQVQWLT